MQSIITHPVFITANEGILLLFLQACIVSSFRFLMNPFEDSRKNLSAMGLIKPKGEENVCIIRTGNYSTCQFCGVTQICTNKVKLTFFAQIFS